MMRYCTFIWPKAALLIIFILLLPPLPSFAEMEDFDFLFESGYMEDFPDNYTVRREFEKIIHGSPFKSLAGTTRLSKLDESRMVKFLVEKQNGSQYLLFLNESDGLTTFPLYSRGSCYIKKDGMDGTIQEMKIFIRADEGSYIRITPAEERSMLELYLFGTPLYRHVLLSKTLDELAVSPFSTIVDAAKVVNWKLIFPEQDNWAYRHVVSMAEEIRRTLPDLPVQEDGAMNEDGEFVFIETLQSAVPGGVNCSGFAKWVMDGLYKPLTGSWMPLEPLREKNLSIRGHSWSEPLEDARDPYFGLDWTRNLAVMIENARFSGDVDVDFADVKDLPFFTYTDDMGYTAEHLPAIMYLLAASDPGYFYLASVNNTSETGIDLRQHFHVAAMFPYFDSEGRFKATVFERYGPVIETPVSVFAERYAPKETGKGDEKTPGGYIHLVRVPALRDFSPPRPDQMNDTFGEVE